MNEEFTIEFLDQLRLVHIKQLRLLGENVFPKA